MRIFPAANGKSSARFKNQLENSSNAPDGQRSVVEEQSLEIDQVSACTNKKKTRWKLRWRRMKISMSEVVICKVY